MRRIFAKKDLNEATSQHLLHIGPSRPWRQLLLQKDGRTARRWSRMAEDLPTNNKEVFF